MKEVADGDVVLHYAARPNNVIASWSRAVGDPYEDTLTWGAHGQAGGRGPVEPQDQSWLEFTSELDIRLMWPETFHATVTG